MVATVPGAPAAARETSASLALRCLNCAKLMQSHTGGLMFDCRACMEEYTANGNKSLKQKGKAIEVLERQIEYEARMEKLQKQDEAVTLENEMIRAVVRKGELQAERDELRKIAVLRVKVANQKELLAHQREQLRPWQERNRLESGRVQESRKYQEEMMKNQTLAAELKTHRSYLDDCTAIMDAQDAAKAAAPKSSSDGAGASNGASNGNKADADSSSATGEGGGSTKQGSTLQSSSQPPRPDTAPDYNAGKKSDKHHHGGGGGGGQNNNNNTSHSVSNNGNDDSTMDRMDATVPMAFSSREHLAEQYQHLEDAEEGQVRQQKALIARATEVARAQIDEERRLAVSDYSTRAVEKRSKDSTKELWAAKRKQEVGLLSSRLPTTPRPHTTALGYRPTIFWQTTVQRPDILCSGDMHFSYTAQSSAAGTYPLGPHSPTPPSKPCDTSKSWHHAPDHHHFAGVGARVDSNNGTVHKGMEEEEEEEEESMFGHLADVLHGDDGDDAIETVEEFQKRMRENLRADEHKYMQGRLKEDNWANMPAGAAAQAQAEAAAEAEARMSKKERKAAAAAAKKKKKKGGGGQDEEVPAMTAKGSHGGGGGGGAYNDKHVTIETILKGAPEKVRDYFQTEVSKAHGDASTSYDKAERAAQKEGLNPQQQHAAEQVVIKARIRLEAADAAVEKVAGRFKPPRSAVNAQTLTSTGSIRRAREEAERKMREAEDSKKAKALERASTKSFSAAQNPYLQAHGQRKPMEFSALSMGRASRFSPIGRASAATYQAWSP